MATIDKQAREIIDKKSFAHVATLMDDGSPQVTPVWVDADDEHILINTAEGRLKPRNVERDPRLAISIPDPDNPYVAVTVRGRVVEKTQDGADEHIDEMAKKYLGEDTYPFRQPGEQRVILKIAPDKLAVAGG